MLMSCNMFCPDFSVVFSLKQFHDILIMKTTHQVRCYHFFILEIIVESVNVIEISK